MLHQRDREWKHIVTEERNPVIADGLMNEAVFKGAFPQSNASLLDPILPCGYALSPEQGRRVKNILFP